MKTSLYYFFSLILIATQSQALQNVDCGAKPYYVLPDKGYQYHQHIAKVPRCHGRGIRKPEVKCLPTNVISQPYKVFYKKSFRLNTIHLPVHSNCKEICTINATSCNQYQSFELQNCRCQCKYNSDPKKCQNPFKWDQNECNCVCPHPPEYHQCSGRKIYDGSICGCTCHEKYSRKCSQIGKYLDSRTCYCRDVKPIIGKSTNECKKGISRFIVIVIVVFEALAIIILYYLVNKYLCNRKKSNGVLFSEESYGDRHNSESPSIDQPDVTYMYEESVENASINNGSKNNLDNPEPKHFMNDLEPVLILDEKLKSTSCNTDEGFFEHDPQDSCSSTFTVSDNIATVTRI